MKLDPDTTAYLFQAAIALAQSEGIDPSDRPTFEKWLSSNMERVAIEAMGLQQSTLQKFFDHRAEIQGAMCEQVHSALQK